MGLSAVISAEKEFVKCESLGVVILEVCSNRDEETVCELTKLESLGAVMRAADEVLACIVVGICDIHLDLDLNLLSPWVPR